MWIIYAIILHILLLGSIFVIYFRSPVITGLRPQKSYTNEQLEAPAKRVVLIVTDGLRAESYFRNNCEDVPHLKQLMLESGGMVGISRTHVPTESRPGHIALIAGLYEDPSAVTRGWKENPIDFDTVFNRSAHTYAWGANDVLHIFAKLADMGPTGRKSLFDSYDHELDFSGKDNTWELDEWVFRHVEQFLQRKQADLQQQTEVVFFLHLLGLDSAGHIHKPGSKLFLENLHRTDKGIWRIVKRFNEVFTDGKTAFVLTSDHGMTDAGSHGAGAVYETETPFFIWGAGIPNRTLPATKFFTLDQQKLPLYDLEQAQFAALMSALLGLPAPMNNFGMLPRGYLNTSAAYAAQAAHSNALQLLEQFLKLCQQHNEGYFSKYLRAFEQLNVSEAAAYELRVQKDIKAEQYELALNESYRVMRAALEGIDYYHSYYRNALLLSTVMTFLGWILYLLQVLLLPGSLYHNKFKPLLNWKYVAVLTMVCFCCLQRISFAVSAFLILPFIVWLFIVRPGIWLALKITVMQLSWKYLLLYLLCAELLVLTFFERRFIALGFLLNAMISNRTSFKNRNLRFYSWLLLVISLTVFPLLPPSVGYHNFMLLLTGSLCVMLRPYLVKSHVSRLAKMLALLALMNALICIYCNMQQYSVPLALQCCSWCFLLYAIFSSWLYRSSTTKQCIELIFLNFTTLYAHFCTSYECLFVLMLASELMLNLTMQNEGNIPTIGDRGIEQLKKYAAKHQLSRYFRLAFGILFYTLFAFFGTGNIASVSSFDPSIIRCFLTKFSPFLIMALVILKLIIPVLLNIILMFGFNPLMRVCEHEMFLCLLIVCDIMGINFLFLVRNQGSWLEIGSSISHFVIMEVTTLVLLLLSYLAKALLHFDLKSMSKFK